MDGKLIFNELSSMQEESRKEFVGAVILDRGSVIDSLMEFGEDVLDDAKVEKCAKAINDRNVFATEEIVEIINHALYNDHKVENALYEFLDRLNESMSKSVMKKLVEKKLVEA